MNLAFRKNRTKTSVLFCRYTNDKRYILVGTTKGFKVYRITQTCPQLVLNYEYDIVSSKIDLLLQKPGGIAAMDICESSNLVFLVAGGKTPKFSTNQVVFFDLQTNQVFTDIQFNSPILSVRSCSDRLIVALVTKLVVFKLDPLEKLYEFEMYWNEHSIFDLSTDAGDVRVLAFPARNRGQVDLVEINGGWSVDAGASPPIPTSTRIAGHSTLISSIALSSKGHLVATASSKGTIVRVWNSRVGSLLHEFRRGADSADIYSMAFDPIYSKLALISDKNTLHIFNLAQQQVKKSSGGKNSLLSNIPYLPKYFSSDWSIKSCSIPALSQSLILFPAVDEQEVDFEVKAKLYNQVLVIGSDGTFICYDFESHTEGKRQYIYNFLE